MILANCSVVKKYITTASLVSSKITVQPFYPLTFFAFCSNLSDDINQEFFQMTNQNVIFFFHQLLFYVYVRLLHGSLGQFENNTPEYYRK